MEVTLLHSTPACLVEIGYRVCYDSFKKSKVRLDKISPCDDTDIEFIKRHVKNGHHSPLEHAVFSFSISGVTRSVLQHVARHRIASLSVKSTRYTLNPFIESVKSGDIEKAKAIVRESTDFPEECINHVIDLFGSYYQFCRDGGTDVDSMKDCIPEGWKTNMVWTINLRSLCNFMKLRLSNSAMPKTREFAQAIYDTLPDWAQDVITTYMEI